jgi:filamin
LGLVWTLILHYQINIGFQEDSKSEEQESESKLSPKQALLSWIQKKLPDKNIRNFTRDWQSGINVAALVDAVSPGVCPEHAAMDESMALENARLAMARAEEWLTIPQVLTPEDLISPGVDELSVMTYLSFFPDCKPKPGAPLLSQASPEQKTAVSPVAVEETVALPEMASLNEQEPDFVKLEPDSSEQEPTEEIDKLDAEEDEEDAPDAPFDPLSWKAFGPGLEDVVHAHDEAEFTIQIGSGRPNELKVKVMNTSMGVMELPVEIKRDDDSTYKVTYSTAEPGQYQISILVSGVDIAGSPFKIVVLDLTKVQVKGPKTNINVGEIATYHVDASFAGPGHITVTLVMPDDNQQQCHITEISAGKYKAEIVPEQCGKHQLSVLFAGIPVLRQPLILDVQEQESGQPDIDLDVVEAKSGRHLVTLSQVSVDAEIRAVKNIIYQNYPKVHVNRIQLRIESRGKGLKDDDSIDSLGLKRGSKLYLKDLGPQIGWKTVFVAEYLGPLLIYPIFYARPELIYGEGASSMPYHGVVK